MRLARVDPDADADRCRHEPAGQSRGWRESVLGRVEGEEEGISLRVDLHAALGRARGCSAERILVEMRPQRGDRAPAATAAAVIGTRKLMRFATRDKRWSNFALSDV